MSCFLSHNPNKLLLALKHVGNHLTPKLPLWPSKTLVDKVFVKGFGRSLYRSNLLHSHIFFHYYFTYQVILFLNVFTHLVVCWFVRPCHRLIVITRGNTTKGITSSLIRNFQRQITSFVALKATTYSTSIVESVVQDCFTLLQLTAPLPKVNTNSEVDLWESILDWKFESMYLMGKNSSQWYTNI